MIGMDKDHKLPCQLQVVQQKPRVLYIFYLLMRSNEHAFVHIQQ